MLYMRPEIHFDYLEPRGWVGKTFSELNDEMEKARIAVKDAINYPYDNSHFVIDDCYGKPALVIGFSCQSIHTWNARNGCSVGSFYEKTGKETILSKLLSDNLVVADTIVSDEMIKLLDGWVSNVSKGLTMCNECNKWVEKYVSYSYAVSVCMSCYNPERHKMPDTRGDN